MCIRDSYRTMGAQAFAAFPWSREVIEQELESRPRKIALIESCTGCGECETRCPYGLPIMDMLAGMLPAMRDIVRIYASIEGAGA